MRYKLDSNGYFTAVFFGCNGLNCAEYNGVIPSGFLNNIKAYRLINGVITLDEEKAKECADQCSKECDNYHLTTKKEVLELLGSGGGGCSGNFILTVDNEGNLYAQIETDDETARMEYDTETGDLSVYQNITFGGS